MVVAVLSAAIVAVTLGTGLVGGGSLLLWGGRVNEGRIGAHVWAGTSAMALRARLVGFGLVLAGALGLGPFLWVVAAVSV